MIFSMYTDVPTCSYCQRCQERFMQKHVAITVGTLLFQLTSSVWHECQCVPTEFSIFATRLASLARNQHHVVSVVHNMETFRSLQHSCRGQCFTRTHVCGDRRTQRLSSACRSFADKCGCEIEQQPVEACASSSWAEAEPRLPHSWRWQDARFGRR